MHGLMHDCVRMYLTKTFGKEVTETIIAGSGLHDITTFCLFQVYDDTLLHRLTTAASKHLDIPQETFLEHLGEFFYHYTVYRGYADLLAGLGRDLLSFLNGLDAMHYFLEMFIYGGIQSPSFRCEILDNGNHILHYYSKRKGLHYVAVGMVRECAKELFNVTSRVTVTDVRQEGEYHHAVLLIENLGSNGESISPDSSANPSRKDAATKSVESAVTSNSNLRISRRDLNAMMPCHVMIDLEGRILSMGDRLENFFGRSTVGCRMDDCFKLICPHLDFSWSSIKQYINLQFVFELMIGNSDQTSSLRIKGQIFTLEDGAHMIFLGALQIVDLSMLRIRGLSLADLPYYDATRDLIVLNQLRSIELSLSTSTFCKPGDYVAPNQSDEGRPFEGIYQISCVEASYYTSMQSRNAKKLEETTTELQLVSRELEKEKHKTDSLLSEILPASVAEALKDGKTVEAASFKEVTILFSDIVCFTVMSSKSNPNQVVDLLNTLFTKFDDLSRYNDVYKVETIGDAYMVCAGAPEEIDDHAQRIANMGLGMVMVSREVTSPTDGRPIQIRVGMHTGGVMAGVVGKRMPRYCLFGDTVNTASRMESHGVPNKIHLSQATFLKLDRQPPIYDVTERGLIPVKGKGQMKTYFIVRHRQKSDSQLIGREPVATAERISENDENVNQSLQIRLSTEQQISLTQNKKRQLCSGVCALT